MQQAWYQALGTLSEPGRPGPPLRELAAGAGARQSGVTSTTAGEMQRPGTPTAQERLVTAVSVGRPGPLKAAPARSCYGGGHLLPSPSV